MTTQADQMTPAEWEKRLLEMSLGHQRKNAAEAAADMISHFRQRADELERRLADVQGWQADGERQSKEQDLWRWLGDLAEQPASNCSALRNLRNSVTEIAVTVGQLRTMDRMTLKDDGTDAG